MRRNFNQPSAVIVGMETNGLGVARALAMDKIHVIGLAGPNWSPSCETNTCEVILNSSWTREGIINDLRSIGGKLKHKAPLIITKDEPVLWISESRKEIEEFYEICLPEHHIVELLMSKKEFHEIAIREGWPLPITWKINNKDELMSCMEEIVYPCILKPQIKNSEFRKNAYKKAFIINNKHELIEKYDIVAQWEKEVVIQEWIEGGDDRIAFCLTYYNQHGEPVVYFPGRKLRQWPVKCGNTAIAEPAPKEWTESIISLTDKIFHKVGFKGLGSIEYKVRLDNNIPVIMEPTVGRTNYQNEIAVVNGINIPLMAYYDLVKQKYHNSNPPSKPVKLIDGPNEFKSAYIYWRNGELGLLRWIKDRSGKKKFMIFRVNDLGPFLASLLVPLSRIFKKVYKIFGKIIRK